MASPETKAILAVLSRLIQAYPDRAPRAETLQIYLDCLLDIPPWLVRQAAERHIEHSAWFPRVSDLRAQAAQIVNTSDFGGLPSIPLDQLTIQAYALEEAFFQEARLDPEEWQALALQLEQSGRPHRAERTLEKFTHLQAQQQERPVKLASVTTEVSESRPDFRNVSETQAC